MLSIKEICEKAGISLHTFQSWRRNDSNLLPKPVAVKKRVIYFDDSILERIKFIREKLAEGQTLTQIEQLLPYQRAREAFFETYGTPGLNLTNEDDLKLAAKANRFYNHWSEGYCMAEVCAALKLDLALSGEPNVLVLPLLDQPEGALEAYVSIVSNNAVHFAQLYAHIRDGIEVLQSVQVALEEYGMLASSMAQEMAGRGTILKSEFIPYLLFKGMDDPEFNSLHWQEHLDKAKILTKLVGAGKEFMAFLERRGEK